MSEDRWNSRVYRAYHDEEERSAFDLFSTIPLFEGTEALLDIGCGDGRLTAEFAQALPSGHVFGIDSSPQMIQEAKDRYGELPQLTFFLQNAENFSFPIQFDYIVSVRTLHWIENLSAVFQNVFHSLKRFGQFVARMGAAGPSVLYRSLDRLYADERWKNLSLVSHYFPQTSELVEQWLYDVGFRNFQVSVVPASHSYGSFFELTKWICCWLPHSLGVSDSNIIDGMSETLATYIYQDQHRSLADPISFDWLNLYIEACL